MPKRSQFKAASPIAGIQAPRINSPLTQAYRRWREGKEHDSDRELQRIGGYSQRDACGIYVKALLPTGYEGQATTAAHGPSLAVPLRLLGNDHLPTLQLGSAARLLSPLSWYSAQEAEMAAGMQGLDARWVCSHYDESDVSHVL